MAFHFLSGTYKTITQPQQNLVLPNILVVMFFFLSLSSLILIGTDCCLLLVNVSVVFLPVTFFFIPAKRLAVKRISEMTRFCVKLYLTKSRQSLVEFQLSHVFFSHSAVNLNNTVCRSVRSRQGAVCHRRQLLPVSGQHGADWQGWGRPRWWHAGDQWRSVTHGSYPLVEQEGEDAG